MKQGSIDIPAIQFQVVYRVEDDGERPSNKELRIYSFDQVDGLTLKEFFEIFNGGMYESFIGICAYVNTTNEIDSQTINQEVIMTEATEIKIWELSDEISKFFEKLLLKNLAEDKLSCKETFTPNQIVSTFCSRYRDRNKRFMKQKVRKLKKEYELRRKDIWD